MNDSMKNIGILISIIVILMVINYIIAIRTIQTNYHPPVHLPPPSPNSTVVAFITDAKPALGKDINNLKKDFDQIKYQSPGNVSIIVAIGDMDPLDNGPVNTEKAYNSSITREIPLFFVMGNHEMMNLIDLPFTQKKFKDYAYLPNPGPAGSMETTYSFDVGDMHIVVLNEYWDGNTDGTCNWHVPNGGLDRDDSCFKYSKSDGGFIPGTLFNWLKKDFKNNKKKWIIVVGHEPLYPTKRHIGDSLDENVANRDMLENLFISNNVIAFIGGHTHFAGIQKIDNIFHVNAGVFGDNKQDGDNFASIIYAYEDVNKNFNLEWKYENPTWASPGLKMFTTG